MPNVRPQTHLKRLRTRVNGRVQPVVNTRDKPRPSTSRTIKPSGSSVEESVIEERTKKDPICTICFEDLSVKLCYNFVCPSSVQEINKDEIQREADQLCPNCRYPYGYVRCGRTKIRDIEAYGKSQQPTWWFINQKAKEIEGAVQIDRSRSNLSPQNHNFILNLEHVRENALVQATNKIGRLKVEKEKAMKEDKSQPFIDDIDEEIELYKNRENIIREVRKMMKAAKDAGILPPEPTYKCDWNLESEMYHVYRAMPGTETREGLATELIQGLPNIAGLSEVTASIVRPAEITREVDANGVERYVRYRVERITVTEDVDMEELRRMGFQVIPVDEESDEEVIIETLEPNEEDEELNGEMEMGM
ncbi:hypothetical protein PRIPAC_93233 [Pristionchus pacificus]|uniref:Uncharacterized protein n=1 Tax=Pristionchus pacificus TaxID=54126 RepID=A0A2A6B9Z8_PRIPA|nr:hypothetical protein PRIPAC_93233 [Pristionchus pacificus]|eukprot:PDM62698.1 hypothetical protein PRIPAC_49913 [Pristionchus pacificus]